MIGSPQSNSCIGSYHKPHILLLFLLIVVFRAILQVALYKAGYLALTADEFGRTVLAAKWSMDPNAVWSGVWLPFHTYLMGTLLRIKWDLLWMPRFIVIFSGMATIGFVYLLTRQLFNSPRVGLISALLFSVNPASIWLSSTPLTEMIHSMLVFAFLWLFFTYLYNPKRVYLISSSIILALANGFRFESWLISALFSLFLLIKAFTQVEQKKSDKNDMLGVGAALVIPWLFPLAWLIGNYVIRGDPFFFLTSIKGYKLIHYGQENSYGKYLAIFIKLDPYATVVSIIAITVSLLRNRKSLPVLAYSAMAVLPFLAFILLHGGQIEPPGNYPRYLAQYTFILYPAMGYLIDYGISLISKTKFVNTASLLLVLSIMSLTQVRSALRFSNDDAGYGIDVGLTIKELREQSPQIANLPVIIELSYWQYLAIHVGANDITRILYDRDLTFDSTAMPLMQADLETFKKCLWGHDVSYIILKHPELRRIVENQLQLQPAREVNGYAFYLITENLRIPNPNTPTRTCPLPFGSGY